MKKLIIAFVCLLSLTGMAQTKSALSPLLNAYYDIKNSLVNSDGKAASENAEIFLKTLNAIDAKSLSAAEQKTLNTYKEKLVLDAKHIAETKDVAHQRDHFSSFSNNMYAMTKTLKLSDSPVYQMYCPMKKTYWMSKEETIKNPYYGKQMLTCGKVTETIK